MKTVFASLCFLSLVACGVDAGVDETDQASSALGATDATRVAPSDRVQNYCEDAAAAMVRALLRKEDAAEGRRGVVLHNPMEEFHEAQRARALYDSAVARCVAAFTEKTPATPKPAGRP